MAALFSALRAAALCSSAPCSSAAAAAAASAAAASAALAALLAAFLAALRSSAAATASASMPSSAPPSSAIPLASAPPAPASAESRWSTRAAVLSKPPPPPAAASRATLLLLLLLLLLPPPPLPTASRISWNASLLAESRDQEASQPSWLALKCSSLTALSSTLPPGVPLTSLSPSTSSLATMDLRLPSRAANSLLTSHTPNLPAARGTK